MTNKEIFTKNNILMGEFTRYMVEHPKFAARIPKGARIVLLPKNDPALAKQNKRQAQEHLKSGQSIVCVNITKVAAQKSRLIRPQLKVLKG